MRGAKRDTLEEFVGLLPLLFYALLAVSLLALATGAPGSGFLLLVLAGCTHVIRVGAEAASQRLQVSREGDGRGLLAARDRRRPTERPF